MIDIEYHINTIFSSTTYRFGKYLVDPGDCWEGFKYVETVLLTHAHFDHIYGLNELLRISPSVKVYTNEAGREMLLNARKNLSFYNDSPFVFKSPDCLVVIEDGDEIEIGDGQIAKAVFTPGHNPSCITWIIGDAIFSGDSYIPGIKTATNLPEGNRLQAIESESKIKQISIGKTIYPGHKI